jgi:hypothetical protein
VVTHQRSFSAGAAPPTGKGQADNILTIDEANAVSQQQ